MKNWDREIAAIAEGEAEEYAIEVDPDEVRYPNYASMAPLRTELQLRLDGAIGDALLLWRQEMDQGLIQS